MNDWSNDEYIKRMIDWPTGLMPFLQILFCTTSRSGGSCFSICLANNTISMFILILWSNGFQIHVIGMVVSLQQSGLLRSVFFKYVIVFFRGYVSIITCIVLCSFVLYHVHDRVSCTLASTCTFLGYFFVWYDTICMVLFFGPTVGNTLGTYQSCVCVRACMLYRY